MCFQKYRMIRLFAFCAVGLGFGVSALAQYHRAPQGERFLSEPSDKDALEIVLDYLNNHRAGLGLSADDLAEYRVSDRYTSNPSKVTYIHINQMYQGIDVFNAVINANLMADGRILSFGQGFRRNLRASANGPIPAMGALEALAKAAAHLKIDLVQTPTILEPATGADRRTLLSDGGISQSPIPAKLVYYPVPDGPVRLAWNLVIDHKGSDDWWNICVDAENGAILFQKNWTIYDAWHPDPHAANPADKRAGERNLAFGSQSRSDNRLMDGSSYNILPLPFETPDHGPFQVVNEPADATASPFGWHDTNGITGPEFTTTQGNNVHAYQDRDGNDLPSNDDPDGGLTLTFNLLPDFNMAPMTYTDAATINLFYWNNIIHDLIYFYGFDEEGGNFQENNYGNGGAGSDSVNAQSQSRADQPPSGTTRNNANFSTPSDGQNPRMRMYEFTFPFNANVEVTAPAGIAGDYIASSAAFGPALPGAGLSGEVVLADDGVDPNSNACEPLINGPAVNGKIAILDRGGCNFTLKVINAQNQGAIGVIIVNNQTDIPSTPGGTDPNVVIPSLMVGRADGQLIKDALAADEPVFVTLTTVVDPPPNRDSDFSSVIMVHEYGHGLSNRSVGGPNNVNCINGEEQPGEGWSDFFALVFTALPTDMAGDGRGIGTWVGWEPTTGPGIRPFFYSTDMNVSSATYNGIITAALPHGVGNIFAVMLWEMYWNMVFKHGFDPDFYNGTGGNNMALQLVMEAMRLQPCEATFPEMRDSLLDADVALFGGANQCEIWCAFAKRGVGVSAVGGSPLSRSDNSEAFDLPPECPVCNVCAPAAILAQPESVDACEGDMVTFTVDAQGTDISFQWRKNGVPIDGATSATFSINGVVVEDGDTYDCEITNACSTLLSDAVTLTVTGPLTYGNDLFPGWNGGLANPDCLDLNGNGILDILEIINALNPA